MSKFTIILIIVIIILLVSNAYFSFKYFSTQEQLEKILSINRVNAKIIVFNKLFVHNVLKNEGEVSYEDRLRIENAVIETRDKEIIDGWHDFLDSRTEAQAQEGTKNLLSLFADKIIY